MLAQNTHDHPSLFLPLYNHRHLLLGNCILQGAEVVIILPMDVIQVYLMALKGVHLGDFPTLEFKILLQTEPPTLFQGTYYQVTVSTLTSEAPFWRSSHFGEEGINLLKSLSQKGNTKPIYQPNSFLLFLQKWPSTDLSPTI